MAKEILTGIDMQLNPIKNLATPVDPRDAVTKQYVDAIGGGSIGGDIDAYYYDVEELPANNSVMYARYRNGTITVNVFESIPDGQMTELQYDPTNNSHLLDSTLQVEHNKIIFQGSEIEGDYYIDPINGNDSNDGTSKTTAWKTLLNLFIRIRDDLKNGLRTFENKTIILLPGVHTIRGTEMRDNGFMDSYGVYLFPLFYDMTFIGFGEQTIVDIIGEAGAVAKRTYVFIGDLNGSFTNGVTFKNIHFKCRNLNTSSNFTSPLIARPGILNPQIKVTFRNCLIVSINGKGLYYANATMGPIRYYNTNVNGLTYNLTNYRGDLVNTESEDSTYGYTVAPDDDMEPTGYAGPRNEEEYDNWVAQHGSNYFTDSCMYIVGEGYATPKKLIDVSLINTLEKIRVIGTVPDSGDIKVAVIAANNIDLSLATTITLYVWNGTWQQITNVANEGMSLEEFNNIPADAWHSLLNMLKANYYAGFHIKVWMKNENNEHTPIYDYMVVKGNLGIGFVDKTYNYDISIGHSNVIIKNPSSESKSNIRIQIIEI